MNTENRLRGMIGKADGALRSPELDWEGFAARAHRRVAIRRSVAFAAAAALVIIGGVGSRALISGQDRSMNPADPPRYEENPADVKDVSATCPEARGFETGQLGAVAYFRDGELHVVDLTTNQDRVLLTDVGDSLSSGVRWSMGGRWISAGGYVVPAAGGEVCTPLGAEPVDVQWAGEDLMLAQEEGVLMVGGPGRGTTDIELEGGELTSYAVNPTTTMVAAGVLDRGPAQAPSPAISGIWLVDPGTGEATELVELTDGVADMAGWSPDGRWVLFWQVPFGSESLAADGAPLYAVSVEGGEPVKVVDVMLPNRDFLTWCGDTLVAASGGDRNVTVGKRLVTVEVPGWNATEHAEEGRSNFWPDCSPDGSYLAATSTPARPETPVGSMRRTIDIIPLEPGGGAGVSFGAPSEFPVWSQNHDPREQVILHVRRDPETPGRAALYLEKIVADLGPTPSYLSTYRYSDIFDWYQP